MQMRQPRLVSVSASFTIFTLCTSAAATQLLSATAKLYKDPLQPRLASHLRVTRRAANQALDHEATRRATRNSVRHS